MKIPIFINQLDDLLLRTSRRFWLTGRKIIVDTSVVTLVNGGGSFSGKDPTSLTVLLATLAVILLKNIVAAN